MEVYYGEDFKGFRGVMQGGGGGLSLIFFNVVVESVVCHWILYANFFYVNYGLVASTEPVWLQGAFYTLTGLFDRVRLQTNARNAVGMIYHPYCTAGTQLESDY